MAQYKRIVPKLLNISKRTDELPVHVHRAWTEEGAWTVVDGEVNRIQRLFVTSQRPNRNPMARIYVASSWRNKYQPEVVAALRKAGHEVYDFRNPKDNPGGFHWADVDENWQDWQPEEYIKNLTHPVAEKGFKADLDAMLWADTCVLVLPCGRSAHTEAGWFAGKGLKTIVYMPEKQEPELMYKLFDRVIGNSQELVDHLQSIECK